MFLRFLFMVLVLVPSLSFAADKLLQESDFVYVGAFKVPNTDMGGPLYHGLAYGGAVIAYNPANNSLFILGHDQDQLVGEISIPEIVKSSDLSSLKRSVVIQNLSDIMEGQKTKLAADGSSVSTSGNKIGGMIVYDGKLLGSDYGYFDGSWKCVRSHFTSGLALAEVGDFKGMFTVGTPLQVPQAGFIAGYMTPIPTNWQEALGGKVISGQSALSILGRTSSGPAAFAFDPANLSMDSVTPVTALLYYPLAHQTIGTYYSSQTLYNKGSSIVGVTFPSGSRSILFTGKQGMGPACYGIGTSIEAESGNRYNKPAPNNTCNGKVMTDTENPCCYDPINSSKGAHAYPYGDYVWVYDAVDLKRVKDGGRVIDNPSPNLVASVMPDSVETYKPWMIKPYITWEIKYPFTQRANYISSGAAAYDEVHKLMYLVQVSVESNDPIIHVFSVNVAGSIAPIVGAPTNLVIKSVN